MNNCPAFTACALAAKLRRPNKDGTTQGKKQMNCNICHNRISKRDVRAGVIGSGDARLSRLTHYGKVACGQCRKQTMIEMIALGLVPLAQVTRYAGQRSKTVFGRQLRAAAMKFIIGAAEDHPQGRPHRTVRGKEIRFGRGLYIRPA